MASWLMKTEPDVCSFDDIWKAPKRTTGWDGVRNYQARNFMRDQMQVGDEVFIYHSNAEPPGIAGIAQVASSAYPDPTQFDPTDPHYDPDSSRESPRWMQVDVKAVKKLPRFVPLDALRANPKLAGMRLLQRGNRLSITPVTAAEWRAILAMGGV
ncbi:MAG: EVE domain-containing protein [Gemmatimonadetes bacterium]|nr:EVE domain-containing protein [Gemmatimonadota bacterium]